VLSVGEGVELRIEDDGADEIAVSGDVLES